jgi:YD repeat-containing protein
MPAQGDNDANTQITALILLEDTWTRTYDDRGNLRTESNLWGETWSYTYDQADRLLSETTPDGWYYTYDTEGRLFAQTAPDGEACIL